MIADMEGSVIARSAARDSLREATHDVHMRLHRHSSFAQLAAGTIEMAPYKMLLARLYGFHVPLETALVQASSALGLEVEMDCRRRVHLLRDDLHSLQSTAAQIEALPRIAALPSLTTCGRIVGTLYVREGATLGGKILARQLDGLLGAGLHGRLFLTGDPGEHGLWQRCCSLVEKVATDGNLDDMIQAAVETFSALEAWLDEDQYR